MQIRFSPMNRQKLVVIPQSSLTIMYKMCINNSQKFKFHFLLTTLPLPLPHTWATCNIKMEKLDLTFHLKKRVRNVFFYIWLFTQNNARKKMYSKFWLFTTTKNGKKMFFYWNAILEVGKCKLSFQDQDKVKTSKCKRSSNPFSCRVPPLVPPLPSKNVLRSCWCCPCLCSFQGDFRVPWYFLMHIGRSQWCFLI